MIDFHNLLLLIFTNIGFITLLMMAASNQELLLLSRLFWIKPYQIDINAGLAGRSNAADGDDGGHESAAATCFWHRAMIRRLPLRDRRPPSVRLAAAADFTIVLQFCLWIFQANRVFPGQFGH